jgi:hypothetical protein
MHTHAHTNAHTNVHTHMHTCAQTRTHTRTHHVMFTQEVKSYTLYVVCSCIPVTKLHHQFISSAVSQSVHKHKLACENFDFNNNNRTNQQVKSSANKIMTAYLSHVQDCYSTHYFVSWITDGLIDWQSAGLIIWTESGFITTETCTINADKLIVAYFV